MASFGLIVDYFLINGGLQISLFRVLKMVWNEKHQKCQAGSLMGYCTYLIDSIGMALLNKIARVRKLSKFVHLMQGSNWRFYSIS